VSYSVEYAKSGRSSCKDTGCKKGIKAGELRVGKNSKNPFNEGEGVMSQWYHPKCFFVAQTRLRAGTKRVESSDDLDNFSDLKDDDQELLNELIENRDKGDKKKKAAPKAKGTKRKAKDEEEEEEEEEEEQEEKKTKKAPAKKAAKAKSAPKKKAKAASKKKSDDDEGEDDGTGEKVYLEADSSSGGKFWECTKKGSSLTVRYGKLGAKGSSKTTEFDDEEAAQKQMDKQVAAKKKGGYAEAD